MNNPVVSGPPCPSPTLNLCVVARSLAPPARSATALGPDRGRNGAGIQERCFLRDSECVSRSVPSLRGGLGGGVAVLEPAGLGLLLGGVEEEEEGGGGVSSSRALSLQGGAGDDDDDDDSEHERFQRICSRGQAGVAREEEAVPARLT